MGRLPAANIHSNDLRDKCPVFIRWKFAPSNKSQIQERQEREENYAFGIYYYANQAIKYPGKRAGAIGAIDQDAQIFACVIR